MFMLASGVFLGCDEDDPASPSETPETASALYVLNGTGNTLSMVDLETGDVYNNQVNIGEWPQGVVYHNDMIYVVSTKFNNIDVVDPETWTVGSQIELGDMNSPEFMAFTDATTAYVTANATNKVFKVNVSTGATLDEIDVGGAPWGICYAGGMLYVMNTNFTWVVDHSEYGQGTVSVIDPATDTVVETVNVGMNPQFAAADANGNVHVVCTGNYADTFGEIHVIDPSTNAVTDTVEIGGSPGVIAMSPDGGTAYVSAWGVGLAVYDTETLVITTDFANALGSGGGAGLIVGPEGNIFTTDSFSNQVIHLDAAGAEVATYDVGDGPTNMALKTTQ
jgi:YVTN family beta-propeller protein